MKQGTVQTAWTATLVRALTAQGFDAEGLATEAGVSLDELAKPDGRISQESSTKMWQLAAETTGNPAIGLVIPDYVLTTTFHALGQSTMASPTIRAALNRIARYSKVTIDLAQVRVIEDGDEVTLDIGWIEGATLPADEAVDAMVASLVSISRIMAGFRVRPRLVRFRRATPTDVGPYNEFFGCPIEFGASSDQIVIPADWVDLPLPGGNEALAQLSDQVTDAYLRSLQVETIIDQVTRALLPALHDGEPSIVTVAAQLGMSRRTLQRRLDAEGVSFRTVLDSIRKDLAIEYLRAKHHSMTEITYLLGFAETASFSRAFKRWTGVAPSKFES